MLLTLTHGEKIKIANQFFKGVAQFEDRSADFRKFARSLHQARLAVPPACRFFAGVTPMSFWVSAILLGSIMTILALLVFVFFTTIPLVAIVKLIIVIAMIPIAINWFRKNRPKEYDGAKIPIDILPS